MATQLQSYEDALEYCRERGMRLTRQRQCILKLLWDTKEHLSASAIYDSLRQQGKEIGHTSVYQNLDVLTKAGVIERIEKVEGCLYSHQNVSHSHVYCLDNGQIIDLMVTLPTEIIASVEAQLGLKVSDYRVEFFAHRTKHLMVHAKGNDSMQGTPGVHVGTVDYINGEKYIKPESE